MIHIRNCDIEITQSKVKNCTEYLSRLASSGSLVLDYETIETWNFVLVNQTNILMMPFNVNMSLPGYFIMYTPGVGRIAYNSIQGNFRDVKLDPNNRFVSLANSSSRFYINIIFRPISLNIYIKRTKTYFYPGFYEIKMWLNKIGKNGEDLEWSNGFDYNTLSQKLTVTDGNFNQHTLTITFNFQGFSFFFNF